MIRIALCDDEQKIHEQVLQYIDKYVKMQERNDLEIFCFNSVRDLNNEVDEDKSFDIFVLDVFIGDGKGTALAKSIRKRGIKNGVYQCQQDHVL